MLLGLIIGSMASGMFFLFGIGLLWAMCWSIKDNISTYKMYRRNKSYGNDIPLSDYNSYDIKEVFYFLTGAIVCIVIGSLILWSSIDITQAHVLCDFKGGTLNDSSQCVLEIKL